MPEPILNEANVRHLLRRTEFVDRNERVTELLALGSIAAAVDNILAVPANPPSVVFTKVENWERGEELTHFWLDRMAGGASRPFQERMAFFWHGHFCSDLSKVNSALLMQQQIDLWRREGLTNIRSLAKTMSTQVAMIRYLDNNQNRATSPNQNFARELMELFLLGVGNYSEADVEASTLAWTGHTDQWNEELTAYRWRDDWHNRNPKSYLGRMINTVSTTDADRRGHGFETIDVVLGNGIVPTTADNVGNRGRPTRDVAAEFLSTKLWNGFATEGAPPADVLTAMRTALVSSDFAVVPWVRAMLTHEGFYADSVKNGLVRTPVEYVVALLHATGKASATATPTWLMDAMGQRLLYPPNVSGWRPNGYWINASAMEGRARTAQSFNWAATQTYWSGPTGLIDLRYGDLTNAQVTARTGSLPTLSNAAYIDLLESSMGIRLTATSKEALVRYATGASVWERNDALLLMMLVPELHVA
jgi:uncharacterized protein (DUF1800 family)